MNSVPVAVGHAGLVAQLLTVFLYLGSEWVMYLLLGLSVVSFGIALERLVFFLRHTGDVERLDHDLRQLLRENKPAQALQRVREDKSLAARVAEAGLETLPQGAAATEEVMSATIIRERATYERGLAFLGTLGNNAPFVGLFGTVLGIIRSFRDLSTNTTQGASAVMSGIAESLVATAVGLLVALPAVALYNYFQRYLKTLVNGGVGINHIVLAFAKAEPESAQVRNVAAGHK